MINYILKEKYGVGLLIISLITFIIYTIQFSSNFLPGLDDDWGIYNNPLVQNLNFGNLKKIWFNETHDNYYLPLTFTSFALDVAIWGNNAFAFKIQNLILFIACGWLIYWLLILIKTPKFVAFSTASLFLLHTIQVENVAWPACRRQTLSMLFYLLTSISLIKYFTSISVHKKILFLFSSLFFFLSLAAKPSTLVFIPNAIVAIVFYNFFKNSNWKKYFYDLSNFIPHLLIACFFIVMNSIANQRNFIENKVSYSFFEHLIIFLGSFGFYVKHIFWGPYSIFYPISLPENLNYIYFISLSFLALTLLAIGIFYLIRKNYLSSYLIFNFFICLIPSALLLITISDFPLNTADRYFFLASPALFCLTSYAIMKLFKKYKKHILFIILSVLTYSTYQQLYNWKDIFSLLEYNINHYPSEEFHYRLAINYFNEGDSSKAFSLLDKADSLEKGIYFNNFFYFDIELASIYQNKGDTKKGKELLKNSLRKDLIFVIDSNQTNEILENKVSELFPLESELYLNYDRYKTLRENIIKEGWAVIKPKRSRN